MKSFKKRSKVISRGFLSALLTGILLIIFVIYSQSSEANTKYLGLGSTGAVFMESDSGKCGLVVRKDKRVFFICRQILMRFWSGGLTNYTYSIDGQTPINHTGVKSGNGRTLAVEKRHSYELIEAIKKAKVITITAYKVDNKLLTEVIDTSDFNEYLVLLNWSK